MKDTFHKDNVDYVPFLCILTALVTHLGKKRQLITVTSLFQWNDFKVLLCLIQNRNSIYIKRDQQRLYPTDHTEVDFCHLSQENFFNFVQITYYILKQKEIHIIRRVQPTYFLSCQLRQKGVFFKFSIILGFLFFDAYNIFQCCQANFSRHLITFQQRCS